MDAKTRRFEGDFHINATFTTISRNGRAFFETGLIKSSLAVMAANDRIVMRDSTGVHDGVVSWPGWCQRNRERSNLNLERIKI
jgi:hypothetical protein